jgi:cellulose synthase/poly-beta-1,6-N-acetylglucosamine synthase-like glycosyltransferase
VRWSRLDAGPELAEDYTTGLAMNSAGWRGAFALNAIAHGDGPACFADFLTRSFNGPCL